MFVMYEIDQQVEFAKTIATDLEQTIIAALTKHGRGKAQRLLKKFLSEDEPSGSRAILIRMVIACVSDPRVKSLLPEMLNFADLPPITVLAEHYHLQNALEAAEEESDPNLRMALLERARDMSIDTMVWLADATAAGSYRSLSQGFIAPEGMLRRH